MASPAIIPNPVAFNTGAVQKFRPILLQGSLVQSTSQVRTSSTDQLPVAVSISSAGQTIKIAVTTHVPSLGRKKARVVSLALQTSLNTYDILNRSPGGKANARTELVSQFAFPERSCGIDTDTVSWSVLNKAFAQTNVHARSTYPTLYIATDFDPEFATRYRCTTVSACHNALVHIIHSAAVLYQHQLGYTLTVAQQFGPTNIGTAKYPPHVLDAAQQLSLRPRRSSMHTGTNTSDDQVDLFQFFTGRTMQEKTIGIAYVGTACRNDRSDFAQTVIQHTSQNLNPIITAHEIGHTLDALHTSSGIMRPSLGKTPPRSFASASMLTISNYLDTWYPECRQGFVQGVATPTPPPKQGGSSPAHPYLGKPVTILLRAATPSPRTVALSATVSSITDDCSVKIRAGNTSRSAHRKPPLIEFAPTELTSVKTGTVNFKVRKTANQNTAVYFVAEHTCRDGTILEVSRVRKFNPNRIQGTSRSRRTKRAWLTALRQSIQ